MGHGTISSRFTGLAAVTVVLALLSSGCAFVARVSESSAPTAPNAPTASGSSNGPSLSADGRYVAFQSSAPDLVAGDTNGVTDVFVRDRSSGAVELVSVSSSEALSSNTSSSPKITPDGRFVVFDSAASNLVPGDTNNTNDEFLRDRQTGTTVRVSVGAGGVQAAGASGQPSVSADGRYVSFVSEAANLVAGDTNNNEDAFVRDLQTGTTTRASVGAGGAQANGFTLNVTMSADGRYVAFSNDAANLVAGDTNGLFDVFVRDRTTATTTRVSVATGGAQATSGTSQSTAISADGRYVAFVSDATNLVAGDTNAVKDVFLRDRTGATTTRVSVATGGAQANGSSLAPAISANGRYVTFSSVAASLGAVTNPAIFRHDRTTGTTLLISRSTSGALANLPSSLPSISGDGSIVGFGSEATNLAGWDRNNVGDVFARIIATNTTETISRYRTVQGNAGSGIVDLSADGQYVTFSSIASNLVPGDTNGTEDIFVRNVATGETEIVSTTSAGALANGVSKEPAISTTGQFVVFESEASNLVPGDTNAVADIFLRDRVAHTTERITVASNGSTPANQQSHEPDVSSDGRYVTFDSFATNLIPGAGLNPFANVYIRDRTTSTTLRVSVDSGNGEPNAQSLEASMSPDARYVVFRSLASDLVPGDTNGRADLFERDRTTGTTTRVSVSTSGAQGDLDGGYAAVTTAVGTSRSSSTATNLVSGDTNNVEDVFVRDVSAGATTRVSVDNAGVQGNLGSGNIKHPSISFDGRYVAFASSASNLVPNDTNGMETRSSATGSWGRRPGCRPRAGSPRRAVPANRS